MRIAIASNGRFHVLDLARELMHLGNEVLFYSWVPRRMAESFGLPLDCHVDLFRTLAPFAALHRVGSRVAPELIEWITTEAVDTAIAATLKDCDVFIGMSGLTLKAARAARRRFGAQVLVERGSQHIIAQQAALEGSNVRGPSNYMIHRELACYQLADVICVGSEQVAASFEIEPANAKKIFVNPYGVDLEMFPLRAAADAHPKTVLMVGNWSYRKGADILVEAVRLLPDIQLLHVGPLGDLPFPDSPQFRHVDAVPQRELARYYAQAAVFVLASREEGMALVQAQALASGLHLVCTDRTGGADLAHSAGLAARIHVATAGDPRDFARNIMNALSATKDQCALSVEDRRLLSWKAYAERYAAMLNTYVVTGRNPPPVARQLEAIDRHKGLTAPPPKAC